MSVRWSEETTLKFVSHYLEYECLWNINSPYHKHKQTKQSAIRELEKTMNIPGFGEKQIRLKIKNIRSTYAQEIKKIKESKDSGVEADLVYIPSLKWFSLMDERLQSVNTIQTRSASNLASNSTHDDDSDTEPTKTAMYTLCDPQISATNNTDNHTHTEKNSTLFEPKYTHPTKKKKISQLSSIVSQLKEITESATALEENEFDVFGKHVSIQLKSMPLILALEAQEHIQLYLNRFRRQQLQNASHQNGITRSNSHLSSDPFSN